ncbi:VAN3-binding protein-like isoform X2 [Phoenix dactylifera]|uniref:VAN3-binding protein-like isoform X2 n=1 Tax=Phoenix dactylifera TaxID=42345 RepID=A0A8B7MT53_PHODC|nr:VAN3-binding protein-like isoform X2 [Phoenix dactylifera]
MEEPRRGIKFGKVSFSRHSSLPSPMNERMEKTREHKAVGLSREKSQQLACFHRLEVPKSPHRVMEFLSRTWSPSSSDFFQILSSNNLVPRLEDCRPVEHDEELEELESENKVHLNGGTGTRSVDQIWTVLSSGKLAPTSPQTHRIYRKWTNVKFIKAWLGGEPISSLLRGSKMKRKEELRLQVAQVHAALSVARLAAGIAGIVANCSFEPSNSKDLSIHSGGGDWGKEMSTVVASAAALVATVCAEAAESVGANRAHVASVVSTGLATRTFADMLTHTATAATCLRGAATLKLRTVAHANSSEDHNILARGSELLIIMPSGRVQLRMVCVCLKHNKLTLRLGKKHLHGVFTRFKECKIGYLMQWRA